MKRVLWIAVVGVSAAAVSLWYFTRPHPLPAPSIIEMREPIVETLIYPGIRLGDDRARTLAVLRKQGIQYKEDDGGNSRHPDPDNATIFYTAAGSIFGTGGNLEATVEAYPKSGRQAYYKLQIPGLSRRKATRIFNLALITSLRCLARPGRQSQTPLTLLIGKWTKPP